MGAGAGAMAEVYRYKGAVRTVKIYKQTTQKLGLSLVGPKTQDDLDHGARGVFVKRVQPTSPAVGLIEAGTQLLSVRGFDLGACTQDVAVRLIKQHTVTTADEEELIELLTSDGACRRAAVPPCVGGAARAVHARARGAKQNQTHTHTQRKGAPRADRWEGRRPRVAGVRACLRVRVRVRVPRVCCYSPMHHPQPASVRLLATAPTHTRFRPE